MAKYIDDDGDSFVDIDGFVSDDNGANIREPNDNNGDPTIPLSNATLETIFEEDKGKDRPKFGP
jgi:hypothetical protein